jgi:hypothetical protein
VLFFLCPDGRKSSDLRGKSVSFLIKRRVKGEGQIADQVRNDGLALQGIAGRGCNDGYGDGTATDTAEAKALLDSGLPRGYKEPLAMTAKGDGASHEIADQVRNDDYGYDKGNMEKDNYDGILETATPHRVSLCETFLSRKGGGKKTTATATATATTEAKALSVTGLPRGDKAPLAMTTKGDGASHEIAGQARNDEWGTATAKALLVSGLPRGYKEPLAMTTLRMGLRMRLRGEPAMTT